MILITGANGVVGHALQQVLDESTYLPVSRQPKSGWLCWDLEQEFNCSQAITTLIHCAPIWLLPKHLSPLVDSGVTQLIVFSSSSVISKQASDDPQEQRLVSLLQTAEDQILAFCRQHKLELSILRPSMIYGYGMDQNVSHVARFIRRFGFAFVAGKAEGLRQPVHSLDLADACLRLIENFKKKSTRTNASSQLDTADSTTEQTVYTLAGGEQIAYRQMVVRIALGLGQKPRVYGIPLIVLRSALRLASLLRRFDYTPNMANRMQDDLIYDNAAAIQAFGFSPQAFLAQPQRDLPNHDH